MHEARHVRAGWEVKALLMNVIAEAELTREDGEDDALKPYNPEGVAAPPWVDELDT